MLLSELSVGKIAWIKSIHGGFILRHRLLDMGLTPTTKVMVLKIAPMGDPIEILVRDYSLIIRKKEASQIEVEVSR